MAYRNKTYVAFASEDIHCYPLTPDQAADVLEVIEDRVGLRSTIVTSQLPVAMWHEALGEPTVADGILDRLLQNVHRIELRGESMRRRGSPDTDTNQPSPTETTAPPSSRRRSGSSQ